MTKRTELIFSGIVFLALILVTVFIIRTPHAFGAITARLFNKPTGYSETYTFFSATSTTATSTNDTSKDGLGWFQITGAKKVVVYFSRGDASAHGNTGSSQFFIQTTRDGVTWDNYNALYEIQATTTPTTITSVVVPAGTSTRLATIDLVRASFYGIRCIVVQTTDGEHTCRAFAEF